ncbi:MAG: hypothetical protein CMP91_01605 [Gammaproteobacteria bacterium]|nr:hypothetical protein [Gammaproteobacteria bacterium]MAY01880.1 hypothetical protein [Gammaproteobacteria bacterium]|tara:strand:- start:633 stop:1109 length:477 start_codon:yes stop_codon:yes gene_type:complete
MNNFLTWVDSSALHDWVNLTPWVFPTMEIIHFTGLSILFGSLLVVDLRVAGFARFINMRDAMKFIPWAMAGFTLNLLSGITLFAWSPFTYAGNVGFQWKMGIIFIAGLNALWFWFGEHNKLINLADGEQAPVSAKVIAIVSLLLWLIVISVARWMAFL